MVQNLRGQKQQTLAIYNSVIIINERLILF